MVLALAYAIQPAGLWVPLALDAAILLVALLDYTLAPSPRDVRVERLLFYPLAVERPNDIPLEVRNGTGSAVSLVIRDDVPEKCRTRYLPLSCTLSPRGQTRISYQLTPEDRGNAEFGDIHFWVAGPMGLVWKHGKSPARRPVKLYPGLALIERHRIKGHPLSVHDRVWSVWRRGEGGDFDSLRDYAVGDDARLIHWGSSARKGRLVVRQNRVERGQTIFLVLDAGRMMTARGVNARKDSSVETAARSTPSGASRSGLTARQPGSSAGSSKDTVTVHRDGDKATESRRRRVQDSMRAGRGPGGILRSLVRTAAEEAVPAGRTKFDHALQAALLLAYAGLEAGDKMGMMAVAREVICFLPPSSDRAQFGRILEATYALEPRMEEPRFHEALSDLSRRLKRRSLVVVFTDLIDERASLGLLRYCLGLLPRHLPLVAAMSDTEVVGVADRVPTETRDLFRQGVAAEILERRGRLLAKLAASGILVLDVPPEQISASVLDRYLDIKRRNVL